MKKYGIIFFSIILVIVFSGCSLVPQIKDQGQTASISGNLWKSTDGGKTWTALTKVNGKARVADVEVLAMEMDPNDSQIIWVGLRQGGLLRSQDGGETWEFSDIFTSEKVYGLAIDPNNSQTIYASAVFEGRGKIFKSEDDGISWKEIYTAASNGPLVIALALDSNNPSILYASTSDNQVIKTQDAGASWKNIFTSDSPILRIVMDSADHELVYLASVEGEIFRSKNSDAAFKKLSPKVSGDFLRDSFTVIETDPDRADWVYVAGASGIIRSQDGGKKWEKIVVLQDPESAPIDALAISPFDSQDMIYGAAQATYRSQDGGTSWTPAQFGSPGLVNVLKYDPADEGVIYLGLKK